MIKEIRLKQEQDIIELSKTKSQKDIAEIYGRSQSGIGLILKRNNNPKERNCRLNMSKTNLDIDFFKEINTNEKAYWLGYICGDGCINKNNNKMTLTSKDEEIIIKFKTDIKSGHKISNTSYFDKRTNKTYLRSSIQIGNELFVNNLINLGVTNKKSNVLGFPDIDEKYYSYFIAGLFDSDGSLSFNKNKIRISQILTLEILMFIQEYLLKYHDISKINMFKVTKNKPNIWKLYLYKDALKFLDFIYQDKYFNYMQRKYIKYYEFKEKN